MSYDYNELVTSLASHRANAAAAALAHEGSDSGSAKYVEHIQEALQVFDALSGHCPMTPLLWMQYAYDMNQLMTSLSSSAGSGSANSVARQTRLETLEVGLNEFPGSAVLQLHYCELLVENLVKSDSSSVTDEERKTVQTALLRALQQVGSGSHRNEGDIVAQLYRLHAYFAIHFQTSQDVALASWLQRARTPMEDANDSLMEEVRTFCSTPQAQKLIPANTLQEEFFPALEEARRWEAKAFSQLRSSEDEITMAMLQEGIAWKESVDFAPPPSEDTDSRFLFVTTSPEFEETVLRGKPPEQISQRLYWNGWGGAATAQAYLQYATACRKFQFPKDDANADKDDLKQKQQQLILSVFERGIADCPTVEGLWIAYLKHLNWLWNNTPEHAPSPQAFKTLTIRAVRNCPFSLSLVQQQLQVSLLLANQKGDSEYVMDPEELLQIITKALDSKFLPTPAQTFDLFATAIRVIQRRILFILATSALGHDPHSKAKEKLPAVLNFDDAELTPSKIPKSKHSNKSPPTLAVNPLNDDAWTEVQDLCEEMRDMYDEAMKRLNKDHSQWTEGRAILQQEWGLVEQFVIGPLSSISSPSNVDNAHMIDNGSDPQKPLSHFEKAIRLHNPPHPDSYRNLIQHVLNHGASTHPIAAASRSPGDVLSRLRQVRGLYQKAVQSVGKAKVKDTTSALQTATTTSVLRDYETALSCLCHDYHEFERLFGSEQSLADAKRLIQKKIQKTTFRSSQQPTPSVPAGPQQHSEEPSGEAPMEVDRDGPSKSPIAKRKASNANDSKGDTDNQDPPTKKRKTEADETLKPSAVLPKLQPKKHHKVKVGHIFHRSHPFTVRVSNLAIQTGEMDLVETFRQEHKCGAIVHVRIQREKPFHAKGSREAKLGISKGWALLQFEERESVEKALDLNEKVELDGNTLHVERSHVPAVGLVPPGMHRAGSKQKKKTGQGKSDVEDKKNSDDKPGDKAPSKPAVGNTKPAGVLSFRPRVVGPKKQHPKAKLDLS